MQGLSGFGSSSGQKLNLSLHATRRRRNLPLLDIDRLENAPPTSALGAPGRPTWLRRGDHFFRISFLCRLLHFAQRLLAFLLQCDTFELVRVLLWVVCFRQVVCITTVVLVVVMAHGGKE